MIPASLLLAAAVGIWLSFIRADRSELPAFKRLDDTRARQRRYRRWVVKPLLLFALSTAIALALLGRLEAMWTMPHEFEAAAALFADGAGSSDDPDSFIGVLAGGLIGGGVLGGLISLWLKRRRKQEGPARPFMLGDVEALLPRNRAELAHAAVLSLSAGFTEELFFRLLLPLLIALVTGDAVAAFCAAGLMFGFAHLYQGWIGVVATMVVGALMTIVYLGTRNLWFAVGLHALVDLFGLVVRPAIGGAWRKA